MAQQVHQIGVVGAGMIAQLHMDNFTGDPRTQVRWLADVNEKALAESAAKYKVPHTTTDYRKMLSDPALDAVVVCTPPWLHLDCGLEVLRAGKHLLMEKPLGAS